jgi:hypothetical protein
VEDWGLGVVSTLSFAMTARRILDFPCTPVFSTLIEACKTTELAMKIDKRAETLNINSTCTALTHKFISSSVSALQTKCLLTG